jgi:hypothetical protein
MKEAVAVLPCAGVIRRIILERVGEADESIPEHEVSSR